MESLTLFEKMTRNERLELLNALHFVDAVLESESYQRNPAAMAVFSRDQHTIVKYEMTAQKVLKGDQHEK